MPKIMILQSDSDDSQYMDWTFPDWNSERRILDLKLRSIERRNRGELPPQTESGYLICFRFYKRPKVEGVYDKSKRTLLGFRIEISSNENGSEVQFEITVLKRSNLCKTSAASRMLMSHPVKVSWAFENRENMLPNPVDLPIRRTRSEERVANLSNSILSVILPPSALYTLPFFFKVSLPNGSLFLG